MVETKLVRVALQGKVNAHTVKCQPTLENLEKSVTTIQKNTMTAIGIGDLVDQENGNPDSHNCIYA